jgi:hypothetical protein
MLRESLIPLIVAATVGCAGDAEKCLLDAQQQVSDDVKILVVPTGSGCIEVKQVGPETPMECIAVDLTADTANWMTQVDESYIEGYSRWCGLENREVAVCVNASCEEVLEVTEIVGHEVAPSYNIETGS